MGAIEIVLIVLAALLVVGVIIGSVIRKKHGKGSCCSDCSNCPYSNQCSGHGRRQPKDCCKNKPDENLGDPNPKLQESGRNESNCTEHFSSED